ncbi:hypothetical protein JWJ90_06460, partial [Desulfobulbus rhabdoformis]|nr:hypothetical protein [Desulfobulbus rhabdoformis]
PHPAPLTSRQAVAPAEQQRPTTQKKTENKAFKAVAPLSSPVQKEQKQQDTQQATPPSPPPREPVSTTIEASNELKPVASLEDRKKHIRQNWDEFLKYVRDRQPWSAAALQMASSVDLKEDQLIVHFTDSADCTMLRQKNNIQGLSEYLLDFFQENLTIQFEVPGSDACSVDPASGLAAQNERRALANDPIVLTALDIFTGQVGDIRIGPRYRTPSEQSTHTTTTNDPPSQVLEDSSQ